jgi:hypothetical protein
MELYIPYIVGSSVSALIGQYAYSYFYYESTSTTIDNIASNLVDDVIEKSVNESINYSLLDTKCNEKKVNSKPVSNNEKLNRLKTILKIECNRTIHSDFKKKNVRRKWMDMLRDYEDIGHEAFIIKWKRA